MDTAHLVREVRLDPSRIVDRATFPFVLPAVRALEEGIELHPQVTFLIGENGSGKSTLGTSTRTLAHWTHTAGGRCTACHMASRS